MIMKSNDISYFEISFAQCEEEYGYMAKFFSIIS